jgi:hypothetical protein
MKTNRIIGISFILGAFGVLIPYILLTFSFDYPDILRQETGVVLTKFHEGGNRLIWTWWAFAILGLPLMVGYSLLGQKLEPKFSLVRTATTLGLIGLIAQLIGLLRWTFVVPILAGNYQTGSQTTKEATLITFEALHQFGGVILGEHIGQLFTIIWTALMTYAFAKLKLFPSWTIGLGYLSALIYLLAQTELFATVMPDVPVLDWAGLLGSSLWLIWLMCIGFQLIQKKQDQFL